MKNKEIKDYNKYKTEWNLSLLYDRDDDPRIESDLRKVEEYFNNFNLRYYEDDKYLIDENALLKVLTDYEFLSGGLPTNTPFLYFHYKKDLNSNDKTLDAKLNLLEERLSKASNKIIFFNIKLGKISKENQNIFLKSKKLERYRYFLKNIFDQAKYNLSELEEKIMVLKSNPAHNLWVRSTEKMVDSLKIKWRGSDVALAEAINTAPNLRTNRRRKLFDIILNKVESVSDFAENEINAIVINKKISDELRGFKKPYSDTVLNYQNDEETVENLIRIVSKYFYLSHRFYELKAKMLGLDELKYADRNANAGKAQKRIEFNEAVEIVSKGFSKLGVEYSEILNKFLENGQIDVFPKLGKTGGAYCSSGTNCPSFVLLNYIPSTSSVMVLGHEMGHAIHAKYSNTEENAIYRDHTIATAEVASTLFENFVFEELLSELNRKEKIIALHDHINDSISTIFRQVACFNFELELHNSIREKGHLNKEEIAELMNKHMASYLGPRFKLDKKDGYYFVNWSHIRNFFYVYSYAFGALISRAMYAKFKEDKSFANKIKEFLSAGSKDSPENIFKSIGIDITNPEFFENGLKDLEKEIGSLEKLIVNKF